MALSKEMRQLDRKWKTGNGWPRRLEWLEIQGLRGWSGQRIDFSFPIVAIVGENGSGKSTLLQAAASVFKAEGGETVRFASEFFPDTAWDTVNAAEIRFGYQEGTNHETGSVRKPTLRWLGNTERPGRRVKYVDLSRLQPVSARVGYAKIAKTAHKEQSSKAFSSDQVGRLSEVMGRNYDAAKMSLSDIDDKREIPVISRNGVPYSGFHQGSGETTVAELLQIDLPKYGLVLIDEIESSLHPRAQRRLIRDLAERCRQQEVQIILTTHSPYILDELPSAARTYILETGREKKLVTGVSPDFAMTQMDDELHPDCELYVEDEAAKTWLAEILSFHAQQVFPRCAIVPYGAANVGQALGKMAEQGRFPRPTVVFLDGDNGSSDGCILLPGEDAPERVVFEGLSQRKWGDLWTRIGRDVSSVTDACANAMLLGDHHDWVRYAANRLLCGGEVLWQAMCAEWVKGVKQEDMRYLIDPIEEVLPH